MIKRKTLKLQNHQRFLDCWWNKRRSLKSRTQCTRWARCRSSLRSRKDVRCRSNCIPEIHLCIGFRFRCRPSTRYPEVFRHISLQILRHPRSCRVSAMSPTNKKLQTASSCRTLRVKLFWHLFALKRPLHRPEKSSRSVEKHLSANRWQMQAHIAKFPSENLACLAWIHFAIGDDSGRHRKCTKTDCTDLRREQVNKIWFSQKKCDKMLLNS